MPRKKATSKRATTRINKSEWIRSQSRSIKAKELLEKAATQGIKLSLAQIYTVRSTGKPSVSKGPRRRVATSSKARSKSKGNNGGDELAFRRLVLSIGLPAAEAYLVELKHSVGL